MDGYAFSSTVSVRFSDCDPIGHLNNAVFFSFLEEARFAWFRSILGPEGFKRYGFILAEARCSFRAPAMPGEALEVGIRVTRIGTKSFGFGYRIERASDRKLIAEADTVQVAYDYASNASKELGPDFRRIVEAHQGAVPAS